MFLSDIFSSKKKDKDYLCVKTFTYFLPTPPARKTGYQEKEFDQVMTHIMQLGFEILDVKMESTTIGVWILCLLGARTPMAAKIELNIDYQEISPLYQQGIKLDPAIEHE